MDAPQSRWHVGTSATLLVAVGSAAYLVLGSDVHAAASCPRMSNELSTALETTMPLIRTFSDSLAGLLQRWTESHDGLQALDERALHDIGVDPSEIDSIEMESRGCSARTRLRIVEAACHG